MGSAELQLLSKLHYENTVRDLLGRLPTPVKNFPVDEEVGPFTFKTAAVTSLQAELYRDAAEEAAAAAVADLSALLPCTPEGNEAGCAQTFVTEFGARAYRSPLAAADVARIMAVYQEVRGTGGSFRDAVRVVITAILQSPKFLYHVEAGDETPGSSYAVNSYALASRLSYFLWDTMPDAALFQAAADGTLGDQSERERQVDRMLTAPRAREAVGRLHRQWLRVDQLDLLTKDGASFPSFTPSLALAMKNEVSDFANHVIFAGDRRLETLFTASYTTTSDPGLLAFYGSTTTAADGTHPLDPSQRAGLLTRAAPMAALASSLEASPIKRGVFVRKNVLCQALPPPPQAVTPPAIDRNASTRQRFAQHTANEACAGCHHLIDPVGFGFEHYDAIGAYQTTQAGLPIDATGELTSSDVDGTFDGAVELSTKLAHSQEVSDCVASQWFRFALARTPTDQDECSMQQLRTALRASDGDLRELIRAIVASDAFRLAHRE